MADNVNYNVNYEDERFTQVQDDKQQALTDLEQTYSGMIGDTDKYYQAQIDASKQWADKQSQLQQEQTDFAIEQIEQQKGQAHKDYLKEQSGAYVDWRKQSNQYGTEAEKMASAGLANTGFSESSQVSMYNTYQNRVMTARESYNQAVLNYNNAIKDARLQNNSILAEIAYQSLQQQLELSLQGFQYKNNLILEQANKKVELDNMYYQRYQDVLQQINTENAMAEEVRQYNQNYEMQVKQYEESVRQFNQEYDLRIKEYEEGIRQFNEEIARLKKKDEQEYQLEIKALQQRAAELAEEKRQFDEQMKFEREQLEAQKPKYVYTTVKSGTTKNGSKAVTYSNKKGSTTYINDGGTGNQKKSSTSSSSSKPPIDMKSVIDLGYGPINTTYLVELENKGIIESYVSGGKTKFRKKATSVANTKK
jgi:hypothetical protein